jgi:hypothetical protein
VDIFTVDLGRSYGVVVWLVDSVEGAWPSCETGRLLSECQKIDNAVKLLLQLANTPMNIRYI